jgi:hypothetical protein
VLELVLKCHRVPALYSGMVLYMAVSRASFLALLEAYHSVMQVCECV